MAKTEFSPTQKEKKIQLFAIRIETAGFTTEADLELTEMWAEGAISRISDRTSHLMVYFVAQKISSATVRERLEGKGAKITVVQQ